MSLAHSNNFRKEFNYIALLGALKNLIPLTYICSKKNFLLNDIHLKFYRRHSADAVVLIRCSQYF